MANRITGINRWGLNPHKQSALFRLRARLTWRQFMREPGQIAGIIGFLLFFLPASLGIGIGSALGYLFLDDPWPGEILAAVFTLVWLIWIIAPLISYRLNEGLDLTRLMVFPLHRRDLLAASVAGTIFDLPSYLTLPVVIAVFVGWFAWPVLPVIVLALLIWYAQVMLTSQMVLHASGGILRSRRFRDLSIIIFSLFGMSCYFLSQFVNYLTRNLTAENFENFSVLVYLQWTPPGAAARAIERAAQNDWLAAILWLLYAGAWLGPITWGWWRVVTRLLTGASLFGGGAAVPPKPIEPRPVRAARTRSSQTFWAWIPFPMRQLMWKEWLQTWRVPQRRIGMLQGIIMPLIFAVIWGINPWGRAEGMPMSPWLFTALLGHMMLAIWAVTSNMLGWEGPGLQSLLLTPISRRTLFAGKALGLLIQLAASSAILAVLLGIAIQSWWVVPGWIAATGVALAGFAITMPGSVRFAHPVNLESTSRSANATGGGCLTGLANGLLIPLGTVVVNLPIIGVFGLLYWQNLTWLIWPAGFMSLGYGLVVFNLGLNYAGRILWNYEPEVLEATSKPGTA